MVDALRIIRHELRRRNTKGAERALHRSRAAIEVIERYSASGEPRPRNQSDDALHSDHVHPLVADDFVTMLTVDDWLAALPRITEVVCVTAAENYRLEQVERAGVTGWAKYATAGIELVPPVDKST